MSLTSNFKKVALVTTGGTILQVADPKTGLIVSDADTKINGLFSKFPALKNSAPFEHIDFSNIDSRDASPDFWLRLTKLVLKLDKQENITGIIILHGTDTLEDTAFFLSQTLNSQISKPVVITGAMNSSCDKNADGPDNLALSFKFLEDFNKKINFKNKKFFTAFNKKIFPGELTQKFKSTGINAFDLIHHPALPENILSLQKVDLDKIKFLPKVEIIYAYPGFNPKYLDSLFENNNKHNISGLIIIGYGSGNISAKLFEKLREFKDKFKNLKISIESRVQSGELKDIYGGPGSAASLINIGCTLSAYNNPNKARIALILEILKEKREDHA